MLTLFRYLWAFPTTILGLPFLVLTYLSHGSIRVVKGSIEIEGKLLDFVLTYLIPIKGGAAAITLGHIILGKNLDCLNACRSHEHVHVRQCEKWGLFFIPVYALSSLQKLIAGRDPYLDNYFEVQARQESEDN